MAICSGRLSINSATKLAFVDEAAAIAFEKGTARQRVLDNKYAEAARYLRYRV